jgi:hypothetical protein
VLKHLQTRMRQLTLPLCLSRSPTMLHGVPVSRLTAGLTLVVCCPATSGVPVPGGIRFQPPVALCRDRFGHRAEYHTARSLFVSTTM